MTKKEKQLVNEQALPTPVRNLFLIEINMEETKENKKGELIGLEKETKYFEVLKTGNDCSEITPGVKVLISSQARPTVIMEKGKIYGIFRETDVICYKK